MTVMWTGTSHVGGRLSRLSGHTRVHRVFYLFCLVGDQLHWYPQFARIPPIHHPRLTHPPASPQSGCAVVALPHTSTIRAATRTARAGRTPPTTAEETATGAVPPRPCVQDAESRRRAPVWGWGNLLQLVPWRCPYLLGAARASLAPALYTRVPERRLLRK